MSLIKQMKQGQSAAASDDTNTAAVAVDQAARNKINKIMSKFAPSKPNQSIPTSGNGEIVQSYAFKTQEQAKQDLDTILSREKPPTMLEIHRLQEEMEMARLYHSPDPDDRKRAMVMASQFLPI